MNAHLKIGTRGSALAQAQAGLVKAVLEKARPGTACELVVIKTTGDDFSAGEKQAAAGVEGSTATRLGAAAGAVKGLFVKEIEEALRDGRIDLAVHSVKDMESDLPEGLTLGAVLKREDPRDVMVTKEGKKLKELPAGARVGASSLRRVAQLKRARRDLEYLPIRGNVDTRLKKLDSGEYDAIVLAGCGLIRLGWKNRISEWLETAVCLPAVGQGALGIEVRADRVDLRELLQAVDDAGSHSEIEAERALLSALGGNCRVPIGGLARADEENMSLEGVVLSPDGLKAVRKQVTGSKRSARKLGIELASHLRAVGADRLLFGNWAEKGNG